MKHLSPTLLTLCLSLLVACGGLGMGGDPDFAGGPLPEASSVEINLGGTPYLSGNPNVQMGMGRHPTPEGALNIGIIMTFTPYGNCGISMVIAGDIQPGTTPAATWTASSEAVWAAPTSVTPSAQA